MRGIGEADGDVEFAVDYDLDASTRGADVTRLFYGTTVEQQSLIYYRSGRRSRTARARS